MLSPTPRRYDQCDHGCSHGDSCTGPPFCTIGTRWQAHHLLVGAVLPLLPRLELLRKRGPWAE